MEFIRYFSTEKSVFFSGRIFRGKDQFNPFGLQCLMPKVSDSEKVIQEGDGPRDRAHFDDLGRDFLGKVRKMVG